MTRARWFVRGLSFSLAVAAVIGTYGCGRKGSAPPLRAAEVGSGDARTRAGRADHGAARPDLGLPGRRDPAAGQRHHPAAPVRRRAPTSRPATCSTRSTRRRTRPRSTRPQAALAVAEANLPAAPLARRAPQGPGRDPRRRPAGRRRRRGRPGRRPRPSVAGEPGPRVRERPHQPRLHADQARRSRAASAGRASPSARSSPPTSRCRWPSIQQLDPIYVDVTQSSADLLRLRRGLASGRLTQDDESRAQGEAAARGRHALPARGDAQVPRRDGGPDHRLGHPAHGLPEPRPRPPARHVRAGDRRGGGRASRRSSPPSRASRRDLKGNPIAWVVSADGKVEQRTLELDRAIGDRWLVTKGLAAGDRVIVEGLQRVRPGDAVTAVPFAGSSGAGGPAAETQVGGAPCPRFFLDRPVFAWVIAIAMMLGGGLAIYNLPISQYPPIAPPSISIRAIYPGASARDRRGQRRPDDRAEDDGPRPDALHALDGRLVGQRGGRAHLRPGHRPGPRLGQGAEQAPARPAVAPRRGAERGASRSASRPATT